MKFLLCLVSVIATAPSASAFMLRQQGLSAARTLFSTKNSLPVVVLADPSGVATASRSRLAVRPRSPTAKTWAKRLNTKEDKLSLHKISGITFVLSSTFILGTGALVGFREIPEWLHFADAAVLGSTACQFFTSIDMAVHHRKHQPQVRDQFLSMAAISMFLAVSATLYTPFTPDFLCDKSHFDSIVIPLVLYNIYVTLSTAQDPRSLLLARENSRHHNGDDDDIDNGNGKSATLMANQQMVNYIVSTVIPLVGSVGFLYYLLADPTHDRDWIVQFAEARGGVSYFYDTLVVTNTCTMYSALLLTLLDKKLVPKHLEFTLATFLLAVPIVPNLLLLF
jgi:hypothetical protein